MKNCESTMPTSVMAPKISSRYRFGTVGSAHTIVPTIAEATHTQVSSRLRKVNAKVIAVRVKPIHIHCCNTNIRCLLHDHEAIRVSHSQSKGNVSAWGPNERPSTGGMADGAGCPAVEGWDSGMTCTVCVSARASHQQARQCAIRPRNPPTVRERVSSNRNIIFIARSLNIHTPLLNIGHALILALSLSNEIYFFARVHVQRRRRRGFVCVAFRRRILRRRYRQSRQDVCRPLPLPATV